MKLKTTRAFLSTFATYTASDIIGEGGSGTVFKVVDDAGSEYALKLLDPGKATKEKVRRFKNELQFCMSNVHPNTVTVIDHGIHVEGDPPSPFYVMPLASGSLRSVIGEGIVAERVLPYFSQIIDGVESAHLKGVVHRDIKPENVLYEEAEDRLLIADFGIARFSEEELYTAVETNDRARLANFQYAAPEQRGRGNEVDARADIYALGLILNEMFTGEIAHGTGYATIASVEPEYGYLDEIVSLMLRQSPADRPQTLDAVKRGLIAHREEFVTRQRVSELKQMVVPITDLDDPLILDPPRLVDFEWDGAILALVLSRGVTPDWEWAFKNLGSHQSLGGKGPENFSFSGRRAMIGAGEQQVQRIIDFFKGWLPQVHAVYREKVEREARQAEERERQQLQASLEHSEARQRVMRNTRI